jgi:hypothetical protein
MSETRTVDLGSESGDYARNDNESKIEDWTVEGTPDLMACPPPMTTLCPS